MIPSNMFVLTCDACRHVFSFNNGVLKVDHVDDACKPLFLLYSSSDSRMSDMVAINHFDLDMPDFSTTSSYADIQIPGVKKVTDAQHFSPIVVDWLMAVMGRAMFDVKEFDVWRKVPWLIGTTDTGKSTLLDHVVKKFYQLHDVGVLE